MKEETPNFSSVNTILLFRSIFGVSPKEVLVSIDDHLPLVHDGGGVGTCRVSPMYYHAFCYMINSKISLTYLYKEVSTTLVYYYHQSYYNEI